MRQTSSFASVGCTGLLAGFLTVMPLSVASAQSLGTAANFGVLAASAVTNIGPTIVTGDLGISPLTAITGFPPGTVTGTIHVSDAVALQAQNDTTTAYDALAALPCDFDLTGQDLGGMTLLPAVYCFDTSAQLTGALTLDAQGNAGARFVFQIGSTLTTASGSSVAIIDSPEQCNNVFWQIGSSATLGTGTSFTGNILALASITLNAGSTVDGRALARTAAVTMSDNLVGAQECICDSACGCVGEGGSCDDGDPCTEGDTCSAAVCAGAAKNCDDSTACTQDSCDASGQCVHLTTGCSCTDDSECNDDNPCTADSCEGSACVLTNLTVACDDGNACTESDVCSGGTCTGGAPLACGDSDVCTTETCDPDSGCMSTENTQSCSDSDACTVLDLCAAGDCVGGLPLDCSDSNVCTTESCDSALGCVSSNNQNTCDDGSSCTSGDVCSGGLCAGASNGACACTRTIGYWKTHALSWPVQSITLGEDTYPKAQAINILKNANSKDSTYMLAAQLIAAKLNVVRYGGLGCQATITQADTFLQGPVDVGTKLTKAQKSVVTSLSTSLDICNNSGGQYCGN